MPPPLDLMILGHGIAGALLAEVSASAGFRVRVWDDGGASSSRVAAGLFTPITGKRLAEGWGTAPGLNCLRRFYPRLEACLGVSFFHPLPTLRVFQSASQRDEWEAKPTSGLLGPLVQVPPPLRGTFGCGRIDGGGWVDLPVLLDALEARRKARGEWGEPLPAMRTVWCTGHRAADHELWACAGWRNAHGDVLTVRAPGFPESHVTSFGRFLLPTGKACFRLGATYNWATRTPVPRQEGRRELEADLQQLTSLPFEVLEHQAGIRPVALARVPIIGPHPEEKDQWIFNGFGSKGVLHAPWLAESLVAHWLGGNPLPKETWAPRRIQRQRDRTRGS